jgi:hypothetical protein
MKLSPEEEEFGAPRYLFVVRSATTKWWSPDRLYCCRNNKPECQRQRLGDEPCLDCEPARPSETAEELYERVMRERAGS